MPQKKVEKQRSEMHVFIYIYTYNVYYKIYLFRTFAVNLSDVLASGFLFTPLTMFVC